MATDLIHDIGYKACTKHSGGTGDTQNLVAQPSLRTRKQPACLTHPDHPEYDVTCPLDLDAGCPPRHSHAQHDAPQFEQWADCERMIKLHSHTSGKECAALLPLFIFVTTCLGTPPSCGGAPTSDH